MNHTTILYLTSKELNKEPLNHLERLLKGSSNSNGCDGDDGHEFLHGKLFGDRESVAQLLNDERKLKYEPIPVFSFFLCFNIFTLALMIHS